MGINGSIYNAIFHHCSISRGGPRLDISRENISHPRRALKAKLRATDQKSSLKFSQHLGMHGSPTDACVVPTYAFSSGISNIKPWEF